jgi:hypothetical protein
MTLQLNEYLQNQNTLYQNDTACFFVMAKKIAVGTQPTAKKHM